MQGRNIKIYACGHREILYVKFITITESITLGSVSLLYYRIIGKLAPTKLTPNSNIF
jgi:hypothetical protein